MIEPLSERELDVLRLLATDLGGPDITRRLIVPLVHRAEVLDLLSRTRNR